jgi:ABC-type polysaccharide/polyol phosphate transport system ATPase subunit
MSAASGRTAPAIELAGVSKVYRRYDRRHFSTLKSALLQRSLARDLKPDETFTALTDVSFSVPEGSTVGVIGRNGSGKSTALKLVAGITKPTSGTVSVRGRVSALIELGAGFHPEISGRENVYINGIMLGLTKREVEQRFDAIVEFAELRDFIEEPVKTYSSGMYMRLGFSVAIHVDPDVLLVDEVLAVGDESFTHKCLDKFAEFKRRGRTTLLVTHTLGLVERFCDEAIWLDAGHKREEGLPKRVIDAYVADVNKQEERFLAAADTEARQETVAAAHPPVQATPVPSSAPESQEAVDTSKAAEGRWGSGPVAITDVALLNRAGEPVHLVHSGDPLTIRVRVRTSQPVKDFVFGVAISGADGQLVYGTNTDLERLEPVSLSGDAEFRVEIDAIDLVEGTYKLDVAVHSTDGVPYDYHRLLYTFRVKSAVKDVGVYRPRHRWAFAGGVTIHARPDDR